MLSLIFLKKSYQLIPFHPGDDPRMAKASGLVITVSIYWNCLINIELSKEFGSMGFFVIVLVLTMINIDVKI